MTNDQYIAKIKAMTLLELLDEIMESPTIMTDPYYREFRIAICDRYDQLIKEEEWYKQSKSAIGTSPSIVAALRKAMTIMVLQSAYVNKEYPLKSQCASSSEGDLVTPALPEGWELVRDRDIRWYLNEANVTSWRRYCIENYCQYRDVNPFAVEKWDTESNHWNVIQKFPDFTTAYHFAVMYILTQEHS